MKKPVEKGHKTPKASTSKESPAAESSGLSRSSRKSLPANLSTSNTNKMAKVAKRVVKAAKISIANPVKLLKKARADKNPKNKTSEKPSQDDSLECPQKEQSLPDAQEMIPFEVQE